MTQQRDRMASLIVLCASTLLATVAMAEELQLMQRPLDPHGTPRPARNARSVPLKTSIYFELGVPAKRMLAHKTMRLTMQSVRSVMLFAPRHA